LTDLLRTFALRPNRPGGSVAGKRTTGARPIWRRLNHAPQSEHGWGARSGIPHYDWRPWHRTTPDHPRRLLPSTKVLRAQSRAGSRSGLTHMKLLRQAIEDRLLRGSYKAC